MSRYLLNALLAGLILSLTFSTGCRNPSLGLDDNAYYSPTQPVKILRHITGDDPGLKEPGVHLINSKDELAGLGSRQLINQDVDFSSHSLVVLTLGSRPTAGYWAQISSLQKTTEQLFIQGKANRPAPDQPAAQALTAPYDAAVVPKLQSLHPHSEVQSVIGQPQP